MIYYPLRINMDYKNFILFIEIILFCRCSALLGRNIREAGETEFLNVVCIVQLENIQTRANEEILCTGILITKEHVLSSEHCFQSLLYTYVEIILRVRHNNRNRRRFMQWWLSFNQWAVDYSKPMVHMDNDIAVIKLHEGVPNSISPAILSTIPHRDLYGKQVVAAGYGHPNSTVIPILTMGYLKIMTNVECNNFVKQRQNNAMDIPDSVLCSIARPFTLLIAGDSGGPLFYENYLIGVSFGCYPLLNNILSSYRTNLHVGIPFYREFIDFAKEA